MKLKNNCSKTFTKFLPGRVNKKLLPMNKDDSSLRVLKTLGQLFLLDKENL